MNKALPFSEIDIYLKGFKETPSGCIVDTQFLIGILYEPHAFHSDAKFLFGKLPEYKIPIYANVTTRSEFVDVQRRIIMTEVLMGMIVKGSKWRLKNEVDLRLRQLRTSIDKKAKEDELPLLSDGQIKELKEMFFPVTMSGTSGWLEICGEYLSALNETWDDLVKLAGVNYMDMTDPEITKLVQAPSWEEMCKISGTTCVGSSDAMILNMAKASKFPFIVSADFDLAYSVIVDPSDKIIFVPENLYRNKIRKFQAWINKI